VVVVVLCLTGDGSSGKVTVVMRGEAAWRHCRALAHV
jgi:hypothetical protein